MFVVSFQNRQQFNLKKKNEYLNSLSDIENRFNIQN